MKICFLGHQGWGFLEGETTVLLDPLEKAMGNGLRRLPVWPPRTLLFEQMPPIAGVILSHEHSDHFDLVTLVHLPFRGAIHIPDLAAGSMRQALEDLGFTPVLMHPYVPFEIAGVAYTPLGLARNPLEPDVYGLLVSEGPEQSFLTTIDGLPDARLGSWLEGHCPGRTLDNYTNNEVELLPHLSNQAGGNPSFHGDAVRRLIDFVEEFRPSRVAISGQGWCFPPDRDIFNHGFFAVTNDLLARAGGVIFPGLDWHVPQPGWVMDLMAPGSIAQASFVLPGAPIDRTYISPSIAGGTTPWTGRPSLEAEEMRRVMGFVQDEFGPLLGAHAPQLLTGLHELASILPGAPGATLFLRMLNGGAVHDFRFDRGRFTFDPVADPGDPYTDYAVGVEMWASDLLALIDGREEAFLIYESSVRWWTHYPQLFREPICIEVFTPFAPRFRPASYLASYRKRMELELTQGR